MVGVRLGFGRAKGYRGRLGVNKELQSALPYYTGAFELKGDALCEKLKKPKNTRLLVLTISNIQKLQFQEKFGESVVAEIVAFIDENTSVVEAQPVEVNTCARAALHRGRELGLRSMGSFCLFGLLAFETGGEALSSEELERAFTEPGVSPDAALDQVL